MRTLGKWFNKYRVAHPIHGIGDEHNGCFMVKKEISTLRVIASADNGWDHVSVSLAYRTPTWDEMEFVKRMFFKDDETAMQLHVPPSEHINYHPHCLHLWRPQGVTIPLPPSIMVGPREATPMRDDAIIPGIGGRQSGRRL